MKKFLIGCGIIVLITGIVCCSGGIYFGMKVNSIGNEYQAMMADIESLNQTYPFIPPENGEVTEERMEEYFAVREVVGQTIKDDETMTELMATQQGQPPNIGFFEIISLMVDFPKKIGLAFKDGLEENAMSPEEYFYLTQRMYIALDNAYLEGDGELTDVYNKLEEVTSQMEAAALQQGNPELAVNFQDALSRINSNAEEVSQAVKDKVKEHSDQLENFPLATYVELLMLQGFNSELVVNPATQSVRYNDETNQIEVIEKPEAEEPVEETPSEQEQPSAIRDGGISND